MLILHNVEIVTFRTDCTSTPIHAPRLQALRLMLSVLRDLVLGLRACRDSRTAPCSATTAHETQCVAGGPPSSGGACPDRVPPRAAGLQAAPAGGGGTQGRGRPVGGARVKSGFVFPIQPCDAPLRRRSSPGGARGGSGGTAQACSRRGRGSQSQGPPSNPAFKPG